jgi:hypothetical protein
MLLAALALVTMFHPSDTLVWGPGALVFALLLFGLRRHHLIAPPKGAATSDAGEPTAPDSDLRQLMAEAKRDFG